MKQKKAQISVFIIIGIALLLLIGAFIYLRTSAVKKEAETGLRVITETVPQEALPVKVFVEQTINRLAKDGIEKLSSHGGYIYLDSFASAPLNPTEAKQVEYVSGFKVPYWHYMESPNECTSCSFSSAMPPLCKEGRDCITNGKSSIEEELEKYINSELEKSLDNFAPFSQQGFEITKEGLPEVDVTIRGKDIIVYVEYPLKVKKEAASKLSQFQNSISSDVSEMYEMAYDIKNYEAENCLIEEHLMNYLTQFYGLENGQLPPVSETTSGTGKIKIWTLNEVERTLKSKTSDAAQVIGIFNTSGFRWPQYTNADDPYYANRQAILDQYVFYPLRKYHDAAVSLIYNQWWEPYLTVKPDENGVIMPTKFGGAGGVAAIFAQLTQTNVYEFQYQYSFPIIVEIRKKDSNGIEHIFRFALEGNIRGNRCLNKGVNVRSMTSIFPSLTCSEAERTKELTLEITDESNSKPVEDVEVSFEADERCSLGYTDKNGKLTTKYPEAVGGFIVLNKEGYLSKFISKDEFTNRIAAKLKPLREKKLAFRIIDMPTLNQMKAAASRAESLGIRNSNLKLPASDDTITVTIKREKSSYQDPDFESIVNLYENDLQPESISLVPGKYNISIQLFLNKGIGIPREVDRICISNPINPGKCAKKPVSISCRETEFQKTTNPECYLKGYTCEGGFFGKDCEADEEIVYGEIKEEDMPSIPNGGAKYDNWKISSYDELDKGDNIIFYLFRQEIPTRHHHLNNLTIYEAYSRDFSYAITPEIE